MNWRPEGWQKQEKYNYYLEIDEDVFEAGADAILDALKKVGEKLYNSEDRVVGWEVIIPEDMP